MNRCFEEINENKYLTSTHTNKSENKIKQYEKLRSKIRYLIRSLTKNQMIMMKNI